MSAVPILTDLMAVPLLVEEVEPGIYMLERLAFHSVITSIDRDIVSAIPERVAGRDGHRSPAHNPNHNSFHTHNISR